MLIDGMAKAAVHQLVKSCAGTNSGMPAGSKVCGILPVTIDTPMNRKYMGGGDTSSWTPMDHLSGEILEWANGKEFKNGSLFQVLTNQQTSFVSV